MALFDGDIPLAELIAASRRPEVIEAMRAFYLEVDRRIAEHRPTCWNSGACCRFGEYGHRLYVTALEVAYCLAVGAAAAEASMPAALPSSADHGRAVLATPASRGEMTASPTRHALPVLIPPITADACPHAYDGQCHVRDRRPLSCRIFYCDPGAQQWQGPFTEECLQELKRLHWELAVPYFYADWMRVLRALEASSPRDV